MSKQEIQLLKQGLIPPGEAGNLDPANGSKKVHYIYDDKFTFIVTH